MKRILGNSIDFHLDSEIALRDLESDISDINKIIQVWKKQLEIDAGNARIMNNIEKSASYMHQEIEQMLEHYYKVLYTSKVDKNDSTFESSSESVLKTFGFTEDELNLLETQCNVLFDEYGERYSSAALAQIVWENVVYQRDEVSSKSNNFTKNNIIQYAKLYLDTKYQM